MKKLKFITALILTTFLTFTSCQDELDNENGQDPNTNSSDSQTASNLERSSQYDGSFDDFLDGMSCSSILLPATATVNGSEVSIISESDYQQVIDILGEFNNDDDTVVFQFPISVRLSNYTEIEITNQTEYDALIDACEEAEANGEDAISCIDINFPITILTYSLNLDQTGSVIIGSEQELYTYMNNFGSGELFAVNYPITATLTDNSIITVTSDLDLQAAVSDCLDDENAQDEAEEDAEELESILVNGMFEIETFVNAGVDTTNDYIEFSINFANDLTIVAENTVNAAVQDVMGTYEVVAQTEVYININFTSNTSFNLLNSTWEVVNYSNTTITLQSTTNAATTLVLTQI